MITEKHSHLPDISKSKSSDIELPIDKVGMSNIEMPIRLKLLGDSFLVPSRLTATVNLIDPKAKGIHMSRIYRSARDTLSAHTLSAELIKKFLKEIDDSQEMLSDSSYVELNFQLPLKRKALKTDDWGWRQYPICIKASRIKGEVQIYLTSSVHYSSTCPCSAALSRQLVADNFIDTFPEKDLLNKKSVQDWLLKESSIVATPHAQRSEAEFTVQLQNSIPDIDFVSLIDLIEKALGTPVQTLVKRADEQEFARLNGTQLMFCEDAGRKLKVALENEKDLLDYKVTVSHYESLHAHDATSTVIKGVAGGLKA